MGQIDNSMVGDRFTIILVSFTNQIFCVYLKKNYIRRYWDL